MQLTDIITNKNWHGDRLGVFTTTTSNGVELEIMEWISIGGLELVGHGESHAWSHHECELLTLEAENRNAFVEMKAALQPANLDELFEAMQTGRVRCFDELPTFGGAEPDDTSGVWSWDATRAIVGTYVDDIEIVSREDYFGAETKLKIMEWCSKTQKWSAG